MSDNQSHLPLYERSPLYQLFISLLVVVVAGLLLFTVFLLAGLFFFDADLEKLSGPFSQAGKKDIGFLRYILISQQLSLFIVPAIILLAKLKPVHQKGFMDIKVPGIKEVVLIVILAFCIFPLTSFTGQINSGMHLPEWLSGLEKWMTEKEDDASRLFDLLMTHGTFGLMIFNLFMIAVIPAIGEELIFRGVFQKILCSLFKSGHLAIWITAFIFSALHFQFFGFAPRFILGLVFGYLFFWSGNILLPMIAHFVNNAVPTLGAYIQGWEKVYSTGDYSLWKQMVVLPIPILISLTIMLYFRNRSREES